MDESELEPGKSYTIPGNTIVTGFAQDSAGSDVQAEFPATNAVLTYIGPASEGHSRFTVSGAEVLGQSIDLRPYWIRVLKPV